MRIKEILVNCNLVEFVGDKNLDIAMLAFDSREVRENTLFFAVRGTRPTDTTISTRPSKTEPPPLSASGSRRPFRKA